MKGTHIGWMTIVGLIAVVLLQFIWLYNVFHILNEEIREKSNTLFAQALVRNADLFLQEIEESEESNEEEINIHISLGSLMDEDPEDFSYERLFSSIRPGLIYEPFAAYNYFISLSTLDSVYVAVLAEGEIKTDVVIQLVNENDSVLQTTRPGWSPSWNTIAVDPQPLRKDGTRQVRAYILSPFASNLQRLSVLLIATGIMMMFVGYCITYQIRIIMRQNRISQVRRDFSHAMIHDMKTPLTSILMGTHILRSGKLDAQPEKKKKYFDIVEDETQHLLDLTNNVLNIAKLEQRNLVLNKENTPLEPIVVTLTEKARAKATKQVEFIIQLQAHSAYADEEYLRQAISNLIENAIKYSRESVTIEISSEDTETQTLIHIRDNGWGIPPKDQLKIFEKFERGDIKLRDPKKKVTGFGLGLNYVQLIAQAHGGSIEIESIEGEYSLFTLHIPKAAPDR